MPASFTKQSFVAAPVDELWRRITSPAGINDELAPWIRMSIPAPFKDSGLDDIELGKYLGRSWLFLFGIIPFDYDDMTIVEHDPGRRFKEVSSMLSMREWRHERVLRPLDDGTEVTDHISFSLRPPLTAVPGLENLVARILSALFTHRHRRLARRFDVN